MLDLASAATIKWKSRAGHTIVSQFQGLYQDEPELCASQSKKSFLVNGDRDKTAKMAGTTSVYLEQYLDSLENLPSELKKNFNRMHDLDTKNKDILVDIDTASDDYLRKVRDLSPTKRKAEMEKIQVWAIAALCVWFYLICVHKRMYRLTTTSQAKLFPIKYLKIYLEFKECWMFHVNFMNALRYFQVNVFFKVAHHDLILQRMFKKAKEISDDKVNIAVHTYELVDKHIRKLDSDLAKFESEMKVSGCRDTLHLPPTQWPPTFLISSQKRTGAAAHLSSPCTVSCSRASARVAGLQISD